MQTKLTKTGYRISKNGTVIDSIESNALTSNTYLGSLTKKDGTFYFFERKQGNIYIYLP